MKRICFVLLVHKKDAQHTAIIKRICDQHTIHVIRKTNKMRDYPITQNVSGHIFSASGVNAVSATKFEK